MQLLWQFAQQRSPLPVLLLISYCLFVAGLGNSQISHMNFISGWISTTLFMFLIRLWDDMADIPVDQLTHPERLLVTAQDKLGNLVLISLLLAAFLCLTQLVRPGLAWLTMLVVAAFAFFFLLKPKLPIVVNVIILNSSLFFPPLYAAYLATGAVSLSHLSIALFIWLGGIAHDFSHSVMHVETDNQEPLNPINQLNQKHMAWSSLGLFVTASVLGVYSYAAGFTSIEFLITLALTSAVVLFFLRPLVSTPNEANAKPFYYLGFVFFLLPVLVNYLALRFF